MNPVSVFRWTLIWLGFCLGRGLTAEWFDPEILHQIRIQLPAAEWEVLRREAPDVLAQLGPQRTNGLAARAYRDHPGKVAFDGAALVDVRIRKRGFIGSVSRERPGFNLEFPEAPDRRGPGGWRRLTLANTQQDASGLHLSLANAFFRDAGVPASRTALVQVEVNGEALGVYTMVEPVDREFLARHFGDGSGPLWEGALTDLRRGSLLAFDAKRGTRPEDRAVLEEVADLLVAEKETDWDRLGQRVDLDQFLGFWAAEVLVDHWDGYANNQNNYFIHRRASDGRLVFLPWGADQCFGSPNPFTPGRAPVSVRATGLLARRLYADPVWRGKYRQRLGELLSQAWDEPRWLSEISRLDRLIGTNAWAGISGRKQVIQRTREFVRKRKASLARELAGPAPDWTFPERTNSMVRLWGHVSAQFETAFHARLPIDWFANGIVDFKLELDGQPRPFTRAGVSASRGFDARETNKVSLSVLGMNGAATFLVPSVQVWKEDFVAGRTARIDFFANQGFFFEGMPMAGQGGAGILSGTLHFDAAGVADGDPVKGRMEADIWRLPR